MLRLAASCGRSPTLRKADLPWKNTIWGQFHLGVPFLLDFWLQTDVIRPEVVGAELVFRAPAGVTIDKRITQLQGKRNGLECRIPITGILDFADHFGYYGIEKDDEYHAAWRTVFFGVTDDEQVERATLLHQGNAPLEVPRLKVPLFPYQARGVRFLHRAGSALLGDEPGLGKTLQALAWASYSGGRTLVICPAGVVGVWLNEIESKTTMSTASLQGIAPKPIPGGDVVVVPFSVVHAHVPLLKQAGFTNLVVDEAHAIKDLQSRRTQAIIELADTMQRRLLLSGSFLLRNNEDLWVPMRMVHPGAPGRQAFRDRYCKVQKKRLGAKGHFRNVDKTVGSQRSAELSQRLSPWLASRRLAEVIEDLPPLREQVIRLDLVGPDLERYRACIQRMKASAAHGQASMGAFREATLALQRVKNEAAKALLEDLDYNEERKMLVFSQHLDPLDEIQSMKRWDGRTIRLDGSVPSARRTEFVAKFQADPRLRVALCQLIAAGTGITLDAADTVIMVDPGWVPALIDQAIRRARRVTTKHPVMAYHFVVRDTLDERRWSRIEERRKALDAIHGGDKVIDANSDEDLERGIYEDLLRGK